MKLDSHNIQAIAERLQAGGLIYMPTDTIPGFVVSALQPNAVERIYELKQRDADKPPTIIIGSTTQLQDLAADTHAALERAHETHWPGPVSILHPVSDNEYLHRGKESLAIRYTADPLLQELLAITGPLATSSANLQGEEPIHSHITAQERFGDKVDLYIESDHSNNPPSRILRVHDDGTEEQLR